MADRETTSVGASPRVAAGACFHCGQPVPSAAAWPVHLDGASHATCCPGCQAVAQTIIDAGHGDFYRHRDAFPETASDALPSVLAELELYDRAEVQKEFVHEASTRRREASLILEGITCAACVWLNERHVRALPGVVEFQVNYSTHRARVVWNPECTALSAVLRAIHDIGYRAHPYDPSRRDADQKRERSRALRRLAVAGIATMQVMMLAVAIWMAEADGGDPAIVDFLRWTAALFALPVVTYAAWPFYRSAWNDLRRRVPGMDVPIAIATLTTYVASVYGVWLGGGVHVYFESAAMFVFFLTASRYLELLGRQRAARSVEGLDRLLPRTALKIAPDGTIEDVALADLCCGDRVRVLPGTALPADGTVIRGESSIDRSLMTGESRPEPVGPGANVIAGSINHGDALDVRVEQLGAQTQLAEIQRLIERAQSEKPRVTRWAERGTGWFIGVVLVLTLVVGLVWLVAIDAERVLWVMVAMLVATCPCALALATPAAQTIVAGNLARRGVVLVQPDRWSGLPEMTDIVFDKTGTLTLGTPEVEGVDWLDPTIDAESPARSLLCARIAAMEAHSSHPVSIPLQRWAIAEARRGGVFDRVDEHPLDAVKSVVGKGLTARFAAPRGAGPSDDSDEETLQIGRAGWAGPGRADTPAGDDASEVWVYRNAVPVLRVRLHDQLRPGAAETVARLRRQGFDVHVLSGDRAATVAALRSALSDAGAAVSDDGFRRGADTGALNLVGDLLPADKLEQVRSLRAQGRRVMVVGDGINDAPVLAAADVAMAMGGGTRIAMTHADLVLLNDRVDLLPELFAQSARSGAVIRQNIAWAIGYNAVALPLAALGLLAPWVAALGMSISSLIVVGNALRLQDVSERRVPREPAGTPAAGDASA